MSIATKSVTGGTAPRQESSHYIVAKAAGDLGKTDEGKKYLSLFTNEGEYGEMIGCTLNANSLERFTEFAEFVVSQIEGGNAVYLNFNQKKAK